MGSSHKKHKHKHNRSANPSSSQALQGQMSSTHNAGQSISQAAAELSRVYSLAQPPDTSPDTAPIPAQDSGSSRKHREKSSDGHGHSHTHHQRRHAAKLALSSLLHESGTSGHFGLGLGIQRRNFGLDLGVDTRHNEGSEGGESRGTAGLKQLARDMPRQLAKEVPKQLGRYLEGGERGRGEVAVGVGVRTRGTEVGVSVGAGRGGVRAGGGGAGESGKVEEPAPPPAPAPEAAPAPQPAPAPEATPAPQWGEGAIGYTSNAAFSGHIRTGHGEYAMSAARESALRIPQQAFIPQQTLVPQQRLTLNEPAKAPVAKRYSCHICRWINEEIERCVSCGHRLCIDCEWLMPIAPTDGAAQEFAIYEDGDSMEVRHTDVEGQRRAENVYTPSEFEQENYVDSSPATPDLPPKVWARQAALAKAHYTTPQSPTSGSPPPSTYTTPQSPSIQSPQPSPVNLSHLSASDYPEPLRLAPSPVRPPGPKSRRVVRDNPFVVADQLSAHPRRVLRVDSDAGIRSRDGQASPQPGQFLARTLVARDKEEEHVVEKPIWQTNRVPLPGFGAERHGALLAARSEKIPTERAAKPIKLDPVMWETLTPSVSKSSGKVAEEGSYQAHPIPGVRKNSDAQQDGPESPASGLHGGCEHLPRSHAVQNTQTCPLREFHCGCRIPTQGYHGQIGCQLQTGHVAPFYLSFGHNPQLHTYPIVQQSGCAGCYGHIRNEQIQAVLWTRVSLYGTASGCGCMSSLAGHGRAYCSDTGNQFVAPGGSWQCHLGGGGCRREVSVQGAEKGRL